MLSSKSTQLVFPDLICKCISQAIRPISPVQIRVKPFKPDLVLNQAIEVLPNASVDYEPNFLSEALEVLFTSECLVLTEYLEAIMPILYGCYVKVLVNLPSARYHIELVGTTADNVDSRVRSVFVYASLEFVSLEILIFVMLKNCGVRALYQLAFVLETQTLLVQSKLITWALITLCFRVVHFGRFQARRSISHDSQELILFCCCCMCIPPYAGVDLPSDFRGSKIKVK